MKQLHYLLLIILCLQYHDNQIFYKTAPYEKKQQQQKSVIETANCRITNIVESHGEQSKTMNYTRLCITIPLKCLQTNSVKCLKIQKEISLTSLYWCSVSVLAHFTKDMARVLVWLSKSLSLRRNHRKCRGGENHRCIGKGREIMYCCTRKRNDFKEKKDDWGGKEKKKGRTKRERGCTYQWISMSLKKPPEDH